MTPSDPLCRRSFLGTASAAAGVTWTAASYARVIGANDRIGVGVIGAGVIGTAHLNVMRSLKDKNNLRPVAVVDCWKTRADKGREIVGAEHSLADYRKLLDMKEADYVVVAVPEHWHAKMTIDAMDAGKAVYCEKPLTHTIPQAQAVLKKQKETGRPLQVGVQGMSDDSYISAREAIRGGVIGKVVQAQIDYVRRYGKEGPWREPQDVQKHVAKPADLDWKAWLGDAPQIDWDPHHYFEWRCYSHYSGGIATDLFIHRITRIMKACDLLYPRRVIGMGGIWQWPDGRDLPDNFEMICEYPRGMTVYCLGTMSNRTSIEHQIRGYRGTLTFTPSGWIARDTDARRVLAEHKKSGGEDQHLHHTNLHNHLRSGEPLNCPPELGLAGVVAVNMANESWRSGQMMGWDKENERMAPAHTLKLGHEPEIAKS